jgi:hypothetical protein
MESWQQHLSEKKSYKKNEKGGNSSKKETSAMKRKAADKIINDLAKEKDKEDKKKEKSDYQSYLDKQLEFKKQKYEDQKKRQIEKIREKGKTESEQQKGKAKQALANVKVNRISSKDKDPTAHTKAIEGIGSLAFGLTKAAYHGAKALKKKKDAERAEKEAAAKQAEMKGKGKPGRPKGEESTASKKSENKSEAPQKALSGTPERKALPPGRPVSKRKRLPPSSEGESRVGQPAAGSKPQLPGSMKRRMLSPSSEGGERVGRAGPDKVGQPAPERKALNPSIDKRKMLKPSSEGESRVGKPAEGSRTKPTLGQRARQNPALKSELMKTRMEEYSNWREEFLFEVEESPKKTEKKKVIDIMKGRNKVTINPLEEDHKEIASGEKRDDEGYMANVELDQMERAIKSLRKKVKKSDTQLPAWVQSKITRAADYIDTASSYMQSDTEVNEEYLDEAPAATNVPYRVMRGLGGALRDLPAATMSQLQGQGAVKGNDAALRRQATRGQRFMDLLRTGKVNKPTAPKPASPAVQQQIDKNTRDRQTMNPQDYFGTRPEKPQERPANTARPTTRPTTRPTERPATPVKPATSSSASASTVDKIKGGMQTYAAQRKAGDMKGAAETGMAVNKLKYGDNFAKPKTPNPLMKNMPGQNKAELDQLRGNAAINSISQSPSAKNILSGTAKSATANQIGKASLDRSASAVEAKPPATPAPGSVPKPPAPKVATPAPGSVPKPPEPKQKINASIEYPEIKNILSEISGGLWEAKKSEMPCNKPKAQAHGSGETGKSHVVKACDGGEEKLIRFGQLGVKGSPKKEGESEEYASRRNRFKTRHAKNIARGKMSAAYWANKVKW